MNRTQYFGSITNIHGLNEWFNVPSRIWRVIWMVVWLSVFGVCVVLVIGHMIDFAAKPVATNVYPWYPDRLPDMLYCPTNVLSMDKIREHLSKSQAFIDMVNNQTTEMARKKGMDMFWTNDIRCSYLDSFFSGGNVYYLSLLGEDSVKEEGTDDYSDVETEQMTKAVYDILSNEVNELLAERKMTFQEFLWDISLEPHQIFREASFAGSKLHIFKFMSARGVCYIVQQKEIQTKGMMRVSGYSLSLRHPTPVETCRWMAPSDKVGFGDQIYKMYPNKVFYVNQPGSYHVSVVPSRLKRVTTRDHPCSPDVHYMDEARCFSNGISEGFCFKKTTCHDGIFQHVMSPDGLVQIQKDYDVKTLCNYFDVRSLCITKYSKAKDTDKYYTNCVHPCITQTAQVHISQHPQVDVNYSSITVALSDMHVGLAYDQSYQIGFGLMISHVGGTMGVYCGISFIAIFHAVYFWAFEAANKIHRGKNKT